MDIRTDTSTYRSTPAGIVATRGARELHFLGTSAAATAKIQQLIATHSFDRLYKAARPFPVRAVKNVRWIKVSA